VIIGSDQPNRREKKRWAVKEKRWRGYARPYLSQLLPSILLVGSTDESWERCSKADVYATWISISQLIL
jgi:hypothetical protein